MRQFEATAKLLESSGFYYLIATNMEGKYSYINPHYANVFRHISDNIVGQPYQITMHPDDTNVCIETSAKCFAHPDKLFPATIRKHDGNGGYVFTQWEYKSMYNEDGSPAGIFCIGYDITKFVSEQQALENAKYEIDKKKIVLEEIAFEHSHLLRMPLSSILGLCNILDKTDADTNTKNICAMILKSANDLDEVIKNIVQKTHDGKYS